MELRPGEAVNAPAINDPTCRTMPADPTEEPPIPPDKPSEPPPESPPGNPRPPEIPPPVQEPGEPPPPEELPEHRPEELPVRGPRKRGHGK